MESSAREASAGNGGSGMQSRSKVWEAWCCFGSYCLRFAWGGAGQQPRHLRLTWTAHKGVGSAAKEPPRVLLYQWPFGRVSSSYLSLGAAL